MHTAGYTYGTAAVARSPVTMKDLADLQECVGWTPRDEAALRKAATFLPQHLDAMLGQWQGVFGRIFVSGFVGKDGQPIDRYLQAAHGRLVMWLKDTLERPMDQAWLDYQNEIALRHHRSKKNRTDGVESTDVVPLRFIVAMVHPMSDIRKFLALGGHTPEEVDAMHAAWGKSLTIQVALWSRPYARDGDW
ncbi:MAG TPA: protoglobin domain-containing protein [Candidatus Thermoplasmatota archaeon]|nr:protoglobin domain-containing protein [Candidatus Thermoplasmatota archaeon]